MASYLSFEELIAIISIPWNVPFPVSVRMLRSTLSATHWRKFVIWSSKVLFTLTADCLKSLTSSDDTEKPDFAKWSTNHFVPKDMSSCTPIPNGIGAIIDLGFEAWAMPCPKLNCFSFEWKRCSRNICKLSGTHFFHNLYRSSPPMKTYVLEFLWCHF